MIPISIWAVTVLTSSCSTKLLVEPDATLEMGLARSILEALVFLQTFSFRRWIVLCYFFPTLVAKLLGLTALNLEADAGRQVGVSLRLKGSVLIRVRCYYHRGS